MDVFSMDFTETEFLKTQSIKHLVWKPFIDDVFFISTDSEGNLERFLKDLNGFHPSIKFTFEKSEMKVNFLDVVIKIKSGRLNTDLCSKLVDSYQYLHYNSCQEKTLRSRKICSERKDLKSLIEDLKGWFLRKCYLQRVAKEKVDRAFSDNQKK